MGADLDATDNNGFTAFDYAMGKSSGNAGRGVVGNIRQETADLIQELALAN
jgi:hypothetical protein